MKALGIDIVSFFESEWPEDEYVDGSELAVADGAIFAEESPDVHLPLNVKYELEDLDASLTPKTGARKIL